MATPRIVTAALGILASCLLAVSAAEGSAHAKAAHHCRAGVFRRCESPKQSIKDVATRRPDHLVRRHVKPNVRKARIPARVDDDLAAIWTNSTVTLVESHVLPAFEPIAVCTPQQVTLRTHHGATRRAPRGPPALRLIRT